MTADAKLPFVFINTAITADGKIAPASRHFVPFSTKRDHRLMMELRTRADAVLSGSRTVDLTKVDLGPGGKKYQRERLRNGFAEFNIRVIVSGAASVNPAAHIFTTRFSPIILLTTEAAPKSRRTHLGKLVDDMFVSPGANLDFRAAFEWLRERWQVKRLLCEGGGEVNAALFTAGLVNELYLTICPLIFGGRTAPTLADGAGIENLEQAVRLKLARMERIKDELYCVYKVL